MLREYGRLIAAISLLVFSAWCGHAWTDRGWSQRWAERDAAEATARTEAVNKAIATHAARVKQLENVNDETKKLLAGEIIARRNADDASGRLQQRIEDILRRARNRSGTTTAERAAAATDITVLADVLRRADRRAGELAEIADRGRVAGLECQRRYEIMSGG